MKHIPSFLILLGVALLAFDQGVRVGAQAAGHVEANWMGFTDCDYRTGEPVSFLNTETVNTEDEAGTLAHELKHEEQVRRAPSCWWGLMWINLNILDAEGEAWCEDVKVDMARGMGRDSAILNSAQWLANYPKPNVSVDSAATHLRKFC